MPAYRFYTIQQNGHIITPPSAHEFPDDVSAKKEAHRIVDGKDIEIWQDDRLVAFVASDES